MDLHNLDLGAPRFIELQLSLVFNERIDQRLLESKAKLLVAQWPTLNTRLNLARTKLIPLEENDTTGLWSARELPSTLNNKFPFLKNTVAPRTVESNILEELIPTNENFHDQMFPRAFKICAASLEDACLMNFTIQHPLCDANGFIYIIEAYCALLQDRDIPSAPLRMPLELCDTNTGEESSNHELGKEAAALRHEKFFVKGWTALVPGALRQHVKRRNGPIRKEMTFLMPHTVIDKIGVVAEQAGIRVTKHDLLMALIHQATIPDAIERLKPFAPPQFSFIMNISKLLRHEASLHNPWLVIPVAPFMLPQMSEIPVAVHIAKHIRSSIVDARRPDVIRQIFEQHKSVREAPLCPTHWGTREPNVVVSSWTNLSLFGLDFPSNMQGKSNQPVYAQCSVKVCPMLKRLGLTFDDGILTWKGEEGFWFQGNLDQKIWDRLDHLRASYSKIL